MLYDLNIPWTPSTSPAELQSTISFASSLGYSVLALNHTINFPLPSQITNPLPKLPSPSAPTAKQQQAATTKQPTILHRVTAVLSDPGQNYRLPALAAAYDILAIRPTTEKAFQAACLSIAEPSLISLDLAQHFGFHFRPKPLMAAVARGVRIEVCYSQVLAAADPRARACFISNLGAIVRSTKGRGIVISSEAKQALSLRAPADVVNMLAVWGLGTERGTEALGVNPRGVVVNEGIKRSGFRGVVNVLEVGAREGDDAKKKQQQQGGGKKGAAAGDKSGKKQGEKRKTPDESGDGQQPAISKRQAKKLRMAQKEKEKGSS
ncbi:RNase P subunit p30 [Colletotrichum musicola]|uniref:RNase P subunit p30 n=1 Tax=Colletotrichum musicola TaxID=2175873 RepID=A0A8H6N1E7_9PEZI|nr:RNase P subunit p30 [Colletotrichum musicola]